MTQIFLNESPLIITKMPDHESFKDHLLSLIDEMPHASIDNTNCTADDRITKSDWNIPDEFPRKYLNFIGPKITEVMTDSLKILNYSGLSFTKIWFQQYVVGDIHNWHVHAGCHFTNVYFVELPDKNFKTEIQTCDRSKIIDFDAEEGDIITFPSYLYHRSPRYHSTTRKTIISFNADLLSSYV